MSAANGLSRNIAQEKSAPQIETSKLTYDFEMPGGARWRHCIPIKNETDGPVELRGLRFESNVDISNPGQLLAPYWQRAVKKKVEGRNLYQYELVLDPPLKLPKGTVDLLQYDVGNNTLGLLKDVAIPTLKIEISADGKEFQKIGWTQADLPPGPHPQKRSILYKANWSQYRPGESKRTMANVQWGSITDITYAFIGFDETGKVFALDSWGEQLELTELVRRINIYKEANRKEGRDVKATLGFGGWTNAEKRMNAVFSAMIANDAARKKFVESAVTLVLDTGLHGLDMDYEYPETEADARNYVTLLQELRKELDEKIGKDAPLSIAAPAGKGNINVLAKQQWQDIAKIAQIRVMGYDYFGAWDKGIRGADFHAAWELDEKSPHAEADKDPQYRSKTQFSLKETLQIFADMGVLNEKIAVGMPNYARAVIVKEPGPRGGLYQPVIGAPAGELNEEGLYSWDAIFNLLNDKPSALDSLGVKKTDWHFYPSDHEYCKKAEMCLLSGQLPNGNWVVLTFLDPKAAAKRAEKIKALGYDGGMLWADYCEPLKPEATIVHAIAEGLCTPQVQLEQKVGESEKIDAAKQAEQRLESGISTQSTGLNPEQDKSKTKEQKFKTTAAYQDFFSYGANIRGHSRYFVLDKINSLLNFLSGANTKAKIIENMRHTNCEDQRTLSGTKSLTKLGTHRNPIKWVLSAMFDPLWMRVFDKPFLTPPKSYQLARRFYSNKQIFECKNVPQLIGDRDVPGVIGTDSYAKMIRGTKPSSFNPELDEGQVLSTDAQPKHYPSLLRTTDAANGEQPGAAPSAPPAVEGLQPASFVPSVP